MYHSWTVRVNAETAKYKVKNKADLRLAGWFEQHLVRAGHPRTWRRVLKPAWKPPQLPGSSTTASATINSETGQYQISVTFRYVCD